MLTATDQRSTRPLHLLAALQLELIAGAFFVLSIGVFVALGYSILSHGARLTDTDAGIRLWLLLQDFGIIRPLLALGAGVLLFRLALRLHARQIGAARWAQTVLLWLIVVVGVAIIQGFSSGANLAPDTAASLTWGLRAAVPWLIAGVFIGGVFVLLARSRSYYVGDEDNRQQAARSAWNLMMPTLLILLAIAVAPLEQVFLTSLTDARFASSREPQFIGLNNYARLLSFRLDALPCERGEDDRCMTTTDRSGQTVTTFPRPRDYLDEGYTSGRFREFSAVELAENRFIFSVRDRDFFEAFVSSVIYTFFAIFLQLTLGMFIAMILASRLRGLTLLRLAMLIPLAIPTLIATQFWDVMFLEDRTGAINSVLLNLGLIDQAQPWLLNYDTQLPAVILVIVWKETPTMALLLLPGLLAISREVYQAAKVDGANAVQRFFLITLPMMRVTIGVALVLRTMVTFRVFDVFDILLGDKSRYSVATYAFKSLILDQDLGYSSAISVTIFAIILVFTVIYVRTLRLDES